MGQNFYRIVRIERLFSFSASNAQEVYNWLSEHSFLDAINNQGSGFVDVGVTDLEQMIEEINVTNAEVLKSIKEDIDIAKKLKNQIITYEVF